MQDEAKERDTQLRKDFNEKFKCDATLDVVKKLLSSPLVAPWYAEWKRQWSASVSVPKFWVDAGLTPGEWERGQTLLAKRRKLRSDTQSLVEEEQVRHRATISSLESQLERKLSETDSPMVRLLEAGVDKLPFEDQLAIAEAPLKKADDVRKAALAKARIKWVEATRAEENLAKKGEGLDPK